MFVIVVVVMSNPAILDAVSSTTSDVEAEEIEEMTIDITQNAEVTASAKPKRWSRSANEEFFVNIMIRCEGLFYYYYMVYLTSFNILITERAVRCTSRGRL